LKLRFSWAASISFLLLAACLTNREEARLEFVNETSSTLCFNRESSGFTGEDCSEIEPNGETVWRPSCGYGEDADTLPLRVVLSLKDEGTAIYSRTAPCRTWQDADALLTIEELDGEFVVTDNLPH
jgi:hypothetical protein